MVISDEISDFRNMNFRFVSSLMKNDELSPRVRISRTASTKPVSVQKGPRVTEAWISGTEGLFLYIMYPKTPFFVIWIMVIKWTSDEIMSHEKHNKISWWKKNSRLFRFSFGDDEPRHRTHSGNTHDEPFRWIGRKSGFSSESKTIFWWSQISLEILRRQNMTRNEREIPRPVLRRAESKKMCAKSAEEMSAGNICAKYCVFAWRKREHW